MDDDDWRFDNDGDCEMGSNSPPNNNLDFQGRPEYHIVPNIVDQAPQVSPELNLRENYVLAIVNKCALSLSETGYYCIAEHSRQIIMALLNYCEAFKDRPYRLSLNFPCAVRGENQLRSWDLYDYLIDILLEHWFGSGIPNRPEREEVESDVMDAYIEFFQPRVQLVNPPEI